MMRVNTRSPEDSAQKRKTCKSKGRRTTQEHASLPSCAAPSEYSAQHGWVGPGGNKQTSAGIRITWALILRTVVKAHWLCTDVVKVEWLSSARHECKE